MISSNVVTPFLTPRTEAIGLDLMTARVRAKPVDYEVRRLPVPCLATVCAIPAPHDLLACLAPYVAVCVGIPDDYLSAHIRSPPSLVENHAFMENVSILLMEHLGIDA